jgi:hypothetical protein
MAAALRAFVFAGIVVALLGSSAHAVPLAVDFGNSVGTGGGPGGTQAGFFAFEGNELAGTAPITNVYANAAGVGGNVSVTISGYTHFRDYTSITSGPFLSQNALLSDSVLRNANGEMTLTLSNLRPGLYNMTTYHHATQFGGGSFDLDLTDALLTNQMIFDNAPVSSGTTPGSISSLSFNFTTFGAPVIIDIRGGDPALHANLNGFQFVFNEIPEPSSASIWWLVGALGSGGIAVCKLRRRER